jgi:hypothetical protein
MTPGCISDPLKYTFSNQAQKHKKISNGSEKGAKNSNGYLREIVFEVKNEN